MTAYEKAKEGRWIQPIRRDYKMRCCDCGLVHRMDFRVSEGRVQLRAFRDQRATAASRREGRRRAERDEKEEYARKRQLERALEKSAKRIEQLERKLEADRARFERLKEKYHG